MRYRIVKNPSRFLRSVIMDEIMEWYLDQPLDMEITISGIDADGGLEIDLKFAGKRCYTTPLPDGTYVWHVFGRKGRFSSLRQAARAED